jgi:hypothetical protein
VPKLVCWCGGGGGARPKQQRRVLSRWWVAGSRERGAGARLWRVRTHAACVPRATTPKEQSGAIEELTNVNSYLVKVRPGFEVSNKTPLRSIGTIGTKEHATIAAGEGEAEGDDDDEEGGGKAPKQEPGADGAPGADGLAGALDMEGLDELMLQVSPSAPSPWSLLHAPGLWVLTPSLGHGWGLLGFNYNPVWFP